MKVSKLMKKSPAYLPPNATIRDAATEMKRLKCGSIPIGQNDRLIGMITDHDICIRGIAEGLDLDASADRVMTKKVLYCFENDDIESALDSMCNQKVHRLIVLNNADSKRMVGMISLSDLAPACNTGALTSKLVLCESRDTSLSEYCA